MPTEYEEEIKIQLAQDSLAGMGVMELSRKYKVPPSTLRAWIKRLNHYHHWIIETPKGPTSKGKCRFCGFTQDFDNTIAENIWSNGRSGRNGRNGRFGSKKSEVTQQTEAEDAK